MNEVRIKRLLEEVRAGRTSVSAGLGQLRELPFEDLGYAKLDHHRDLRHGFPEVVFCPGKTVPQIREIVQRLAARNDSVLASRAERRVYLAIKTIKGIGRVVYNEPARMVLVGQKRPVKSAGTIVVACAGTSDIPVAEEAAFTAEVMGHRVTRLFDVGVAGLHRLLYRSRDLTAAEVIVVVAGMEGALASVVGGLVSCPVIAVPTSVGYGANFKGVSALLAMLNSCSPNVATVNIDNGFGAGYMASLINKKKQK